MTRHPIRKFFGLFVLYSFIILGIFALQFRSQSIFSKNFAQLRLTLTQNKDESKENPFLDTFYIAYKGMTLFTDEESKSILTYKNGNQTSLVFTDWKEIDENSFELLFSENVSLHCKISGEKHDSLNISVNLPSTAKEISIPYKLAKSYTVTESNSKRMLLKSSNTQTALKAPEIRESEIILLASNKTLSYADYIPITRFTFDTILENPLAQVDSYMQTKKNIKNASVNNFTSSSDVLTEQVVNAYLAELTPRGKYLDAIAQVPQSFREGTRRTYISAPYLNNLVNMNNSLVMQLENLDYKMNFALEKNDLSIFETDNLGEFLLTRKSSVASQLLQLPSKQEVFEPTTKQASGILNTYSVLKSQNSEMADILLPVLDKSLEIVESACYTENDMLFITSNNEKLDNLQSIRIGKTLVNYGSITKNTTVQAGGYMLINSQIPAIENLDLRTTGEIYAILEEDSTFYPHMNFVNKENGTTSWAWTVAQSISYSKDEEGTITLATKFPQGATHYMILNNIEPFKSIEIYGMKFRTDPRFETYNSSGYVYNARTKTLFLKYRHKAETEIVRLIYKEEVVPEPTETTETTSTPTETSPETNTSGEKPAV
ncbi:MAG: hypothetical protein IIX47_08130 [Spirochaetaceae bacterium]|nr:hypothetical protein [Spirochaetaceae bacterium]